MVDFGNDSQLFFFWLGKINIFGLKVRHKGNPKKEQQICGIQLLVGKSIFFLVNHSFIFCKENLKAKSFSGVIMLVRCKSALCSLHIA